ncbi:MAG TPA: CRISPR-associated endonuclease Cas1 [Kiritimatiellia bacterium]|nr:CRISPR-associated endonuclease Cas1 [Kiritimatiellia bacterium]HMO98482.1 CRISPR-associated endonuclease Cas1 [Kiritimatiellia bacterium]HMP96511.1 CRISPR-associated endonuclease Cas1 [Kiritimatiellia bacterium]
MSTLFITTQGAYLRKRAGQFVVTNKDQELTVLPEAMLECVVLLGAVQVSTQAMTALLDQGVPLLYLSRSGHFRGMLQPGFPKNVERRLIQYECASNPEFSTTAAKCLVKAKMDASLFTLSKWRRNDWGDTSSALDGIRSCRDRLTDAERMEAVLAVEAQAAKYHFGGLAAALPPGFRWEGRNRQPPRDPVNALLSLSYMLVVGFAVAAAYAGGLDPFVGFLHQLEYGRPSFALDLLEPLRAAWCDHAVVKALQAEELRPEDFETTAADGCRLTTEGFKRYIHLFRNQTDPDNPSGINRTLQAYVRDFQQAMKDRRPPVWTEAMQEAA